MSDGDVLEVEGLVKHFHVGSQLLGGGGTVHAVDGVSLTIGPGELLGLVGESGSGKSTVANCIARLVEPTAGTNKIRGTDVTHLSRRQTRPLRREVHMVFQDPYSSLNPRMTRGQIVGEPLRLHRMVPRRDRDRRVVQYTQALLSAAVVLDPVEQRTRTRVVLAGDVPSPLAPPSGCRFRTRCPLAAQSAPQSVEEEPELQLVGSDHLVACHLVGPGGAAPVALDLTAGGV